MIANKEKNFISAVVYIYNNEEHIISFLSNLHKTLESTFNKFEIICVNDNSNDKSVDKIKEYADNVKTSVISIINMSFYQGVELSMNAGVNLAIGDFVYEFDNIYKDYENNIIIDSYFQALKGFDIVSVTPKNHKRRSSKVFYKIFNSISKSSYDINTESFRILSRRAINRVHSMSKTIPYRKALYSNCGLKVYNIIYDNNKKYSVKENKKIKDTRKLVAIDSLILFTDLAYKLSIIMTTIMMLTTVFTAIYALSIFFSVEKPIEGWTTTILFLSVAFFGVFAVLTIIIKYLSIIIDLIFKKQQYTIESIEKITK